ncbi:ABC transporter ATP-binding protein [soil metagenome]
MQEEHAVVAELLGVRKEYRTGDTTITALDTTSVQFRRGQLTLIIGPSGSGKTTLLSILGCVIYSSTGEVRINGKSVRGLSQNALASVRLHNVGFIFQNFNLLAPLSALENVMQPLLLMGVSKGNARERASRALDKVGMTSRMKNLPRALSGGQQQRVAIARALVTDPTILLCDEPTASLDASSVVSVMKELKELSQSGKAVAVVTHDPRLKPFADRIIYVHNGVVSDEPEENDL